MVESATARISIAVDRGDPIDSQGFRHTSLLFSFPEQSSTLLAHIIIGPQGEDVFELRTNYNPAESVTLARLVDVGFLAEQMSREQLLAMLRCVLINVEDRESNRQTWKGNAPTGCCETSSCSAIYSTKMVSTAW